MIHEVFGGPWGVKINFKPGVDIRMNEVIPNMHLLLLWDQQREIDAVLNRQTEHLAI